MFMTFDNFHRHRNQRPSSPCIIDVLTFGRGCPESISHSFDCKRRDRSKYDRQPYMSDSSSPVTLTVGTSDSML